MFVESLKISLVAVVLTLLVSLGAAAVATDTQKNPPNGVSSLGFGDRVMAMLVYMRNVPWVTSLVVFVLTMVSFILSELMPF